MRLPKNIKVSVSKLSQLFNETTNSYKLLFFAALLKKILALDKNLPAKISIKELADEMLILAWYPSVFCHLTFGSQDLIAKTISNLKFDYIGSTINGNKHEETLRHAILEQRNRIQIDKLLRYVPYRLLTPFFSEELRGLKDGVKNLKINELANNDFNRSIPIYRLIENETVIELHPLWLDYLIENFSIVEGWLSWHWCKYLQSKNPHVPAIIKKAFPDKKRSSLTLQTNFWKDVMNKTDVKCIYSGALLNQQPFALDHYLPWSFVNHDQAWNLIPVLPSANLAKSNSLPHADYLNLFIDNQHLSLTVERNIKFQIIINDYMSGLKLNSKELLNIDNLRSSYHQTLQPLETIAKRMGFKHDWLQ